MLLKFNLLSDVHLEYYKQHKLLKLLDKIKSAIPKENKNILLLAGDIGRVDTKDHYDSYRVFLNTLSPFYQQMILIAGNHEYYGSCIEETNKKLLELEKSIDNLTFLNNGVYTINRGDKKPISILGSTMWGSADLIHHRSINDFHKIDDYRDKPTEYLINHKTSKLWLDEQIKTYQDKHDIIVMTHHIPSLRLNDPKYAKYAHLNLFYTSQLDHLFENKSLKYWTYGHTHTGYNGKVADCDITFLCNPYGYPGENDKINYIASFHLD